MIIDTHIHTFPDHLAERALGKLSKTSHIQPSTDGTVAGTLREMDKYGIDMAISLNIAVKPNQEDKVNAFAIRCNSDRIVMFGSVNPYSDNIVSELHRLKDNGIQGIKLHPEYQGFYVDDPICDIIYRTCEELGLIIVFHAGFDSAYPLGRHASPKRLAKVVKRYPNATFVLAHLGGMLRWRGVVRHIVGLNCYLDTGMCAGYISTRLANKIIHAHGVDKILFASDSPWSTWDKMKDFISSLDLSEEERDKIMYKNALKLLGREIV